MKITKYEHSTILAETPDRVALFDPGVFTWKSDKFNLDDIARIDRLIITHPHPDHLSPEAVAAIVAKFPDVHIVGNQACQNAIEDAGISVTFRDTTVCSCSFEAPHHSIEPFGKTVPNMGFHFKEQLTHPGDSYTFSETKEILAMPFVAPWGTVIDALKKTIELKPKHVVPIHDWFYSDDAKAWLYNRLEEVLAEHDIKLHKLMPGDSVEI